VNFNCGDNFCLEFVGWLNDPKKIFKKITGSIFFKKKSYDNIKRENKLKKNYQSLLIFQIRDPDHHTYQKYYT